MKAQTAIRGQVCSRYLTNTIFLSLLCDNYIKNAMLFPGTGFRQEHLPREGEIRETGNGKRRKDWKQPFRGLFTKVRTLQYKRC